MPEIIQSFVVAFPRDVVWRELHDFAMVAGAMPGVSLNDAPSDAHLGGSLAVKLGPITSSFAGEAEVAMDDATFTGTVRGQALDRKNNSRARSEILFSLAGQDRATRLHLKIDYTLSGPLAQFGRGSIVQEMAQRLTGEFAHNLEAAIAARLASSATLNAAPAEAAAPGGSRQPPLGSAAAPVGLFGLLWSAFLAWLRRRFTGQAGGKDRHA